MSNNKLIELQEALDLLKDKDVDALKNALTLIGEPVAEYDASTPVDAPGSKVKIVVLQRGWVAVGIYTRTATEGLLEKASTIRVWGTTKGLGELAKEGPTSSTKLDPAGTVRFELLTTVLTIDVKDDSKWLAKL